MTFEIKLFSILFIWRRM